MKYVEVSIDKERVMTEVRRHSQYMVLLGLEGKDRIEKEEIKRRRGRDALKTDKELLNRFWLESLGHLHQRLQSYIASMRENESGVTLSIIVAGGIGSLKAEMLESGLTSYMIGKVGSRWYAISMPSEAASAEAFAEASLEECERRLCHRGAPKRKS